MEPVDLAEFGSRPQDSVRRIESWTDCMSQQTPPPPEGARPFVGIHMRCCNVYVRAYPNAQKDACVAWCPRCCAPVRVPIVEEGGSSNRFFVGE